MFCGVDFGTSHCAMGIVENQQVQLVKLFQDEVYLPSSLYSYDRRLIANYIENLMVKHSPTALTEFRQTRQLNLQQNASVRRQHDLSATEPACFVGKPAIEEYLAMPEEGYYVKSPKSFLGASGLPQNQLHFFEDIITAMMLAIKDNAEKSLPGCLEKVVIGRPVNFQGVNSEASNQQALNILSIAGKRAGFKQVDFLYEPIAAGIDFETQLSTNKTVLVVDIGGGTTDCSIVKMGPEHCKQADRSKDFLAHTGKRIGGNDLDIYFALNSLMPLFGYNSQFKNGLDLPRSYFWQAVSINNLVDQAAFYHQKNINALTLLQREAQNSQLIGRLIELQQTKQNHRLVRESELAKIKLSDTSPLNVTLDFIEQNLIADIALSDFDTAIQKPLSDIKSLIQEALQQAETKPDLIYITGGSAKSTILRSAIAAELPGVPLLDGDYFGSVTAGLTKWAEKIYQ